MRRVTFLLAQTVDGFFKLGSCGGADTRVQVTQGVTSSFVIPRFSDAVLHFFKDFCFFGGGECDVLTAEGMGFVCVVEV